MGLTIICCIIPYMRFRLLFPLLLLPLLAAAQDPQALYLEQAGWDMPLYRGRTATNYSFSYNGTYLWDRSGFRSGDLSYAGKVYRNMEMDINAHQQHLLLRYPDSFNTVDLGNEAVDWFTLGQDRYVNLRRRGIDVPEGFYKVVYEGDASVYERIDKEFRRDISISNDGQIGYMDPAWKEGVFELFIQRRNWYYVAPNGQATRFRKQNFLLRTHPDKRRQATRHLKETGMDKADFSRWCQAYMNFVEHGK